MNETDAAMDACTFLPRLRVHTGQGNYVDRFEDKAGDWAREPFLS